MFASTLTSDPSPPELERITTLLCGDLAVACQATISNWSTRLVKFLCCRCQTIALQMSFVSTLAWSHSHRLNTCHPSAWRWTLSFPCGSNYLNLSLRVIFWNDSFLLRGEWDGPRKRSKLYKCLFFIVPIKSIGMSYKQSLLLIPLHAHD